MTADPYVPSRKDHFSFGIWTVTASGASLRNPDDFTLSLIQANIEDFSTSLSQLRGNPYVDRPESIPV